MRSSAGVVVLLLLASASAQAQTGGRRIGGFAGYDGREERRLLGIRSVRAFPERILLFDRRSADLGLAATPGSAFGYLDLQRVIEEEDDEPGVLLGIGLGLQLADRSDNTGFLGGVSATFLPGRQEALSLSARAIYGPPAPALQLLLGLTFSRGSGIRIPRPPVVASPRLGL